MRVLGIDPGTLATGFGVVESLPGRKVVHITHGVIKTKPSQPLWERLRTIVNGVREVATAYPPDVMVIERCFVSKNIQSALKLGHTRGAIMVAGLEAGAEIVEYAPTEIKSAVAGTGRADKNQVAQMVRMLLSLEKAAPSDASDALAAAICHIHAHGFNQRVAAAKAVSRSGAGRRGRR